MYLSNLLSPFMTLERAIVRVKIHVTKAALSLCLLSHYAMLAQTNTCMPARSAAALQKAHADGVVKDSSLANNHRQGIA